MAKTEYTFTKTINSDVLDTALQAASLSGYDGFTTNGKGAIRLFVDDSVSKSTVQAIIDSHDNTAKTTEQQEKETDEADKQAILDDTDTMLTQWITDKTTLSKVTALTTVAEIEPILTRMIEAIEKLSKAQRAQIRS